MPCIHCFIARQSRQTDRQTDQSLLTDAETEEGTEGDHGGVGGGEHVEDAGDTAHDHHDVVKEQGVHPREVRQPAGNHSTYRVGDA